MRKWKYDQSGLFDSVYDPTIELDLVEEEDKVSSFPSLHWFLSLAFSLLLDFKIIMISDALS